MKLADVLADDTPPTGPIKLNEAVKRAILPEEPSDQVASRNPILPLVTVLGQKRQSERGEPQVKFGMPGMVAGAVETAKIPGEILQGKRQGTEAEARDVALLMAGIEAPAGAGAAKAAGRAIDAAAGKTAAKSTGEAAGEAAAKEAVSVEAKGEAAPAALPGESAKPIAEEGPLSRPAAVAQPRETEDQLFHLQSLRNADAVEAVKRLKAVPEGVKPETWEKLYHHEENPEGVALTPEEQTLYDRHVKPLREEANQLSAELERLGYPTEREEARGGPPKPSAPDRTPGTSGYRLSDDAAILKQVTRAEPKSGSTVLLAIEKDGKAVGILHGTIRGADLHVVGVNGLGRDRVGAFGPTAIRDFAGQLKERYPAIKTISGARISGARKAAGKQDISARVFVEKPRSLGYTPRYVKGRTRSFGEVLEQWKQGVDRPMGGGAPGRSLRKTVDAQKSRRFWKAINPETGEARVVHVGTDGRVLAFDGTPKAEDFGQFGKGQKIAEGAKVRAGGQQWRLEPATTQEIESVAQTRYSKNVLANRLDNLAKLRSAVRNARFIEQMKGSPEWDSVAVETRKTNAPPETGGRPWRVPKLMQFRQYYVEPRLADALDDFARDTEVEGIDTVLHKAGRAMNFFMFLNPKAHIDNVFNHMMVDRGLVGNLIHAPQTARNLIRAAKAVTTADPSYIRAMKAGMSLPYSRFLSADLHSTLIKKLGGEVERSPVPWTRLAQMAGYPDAKTMLKRWGQVPSRVLWASNDIFAMSRLYDLQARGIPIEKAFKSVEEGIPNYRVPGQVMGSRALAQLFSNPAWGRFGRYQYGRLAGYFHALRGAFGRDRGIGERAENLDKLAMLGVYLTVIYPALDYAWRSLTGNENAKTTRSGAASIPQAVIDAAKGDKKIGDVAQSIFTPGVPMELPLELYYGKRLWSGQPIMRDADVRAGRWKQVMRDAGSYAAEKFSAIGQIMSPATGKESAGQIGLRALGVSTPSEAQVRGREYYRQKDARDAAKRAAREELRANP